MLAYSTAKKLRKSDDCQPGWAHPMLQPAALVQHQLSCVGDASTDALKISVVNVQGRNDARDIALEEITVKFNGLTIEAAKSGGTWWGCVRIPHQRQLDGGLLTLGGVGAGSVTQPTSLEKVGVRVRS